MMRVVSLSSGHGFYAPPARVIDNEKCGGRVGVNHIFARWLLCYFESNEADREREV